MAKLLFSGVMKLSLAPNGFDFSQLPWNSAESLERSNVMASPKANYIVDIIGSVIPATEGTATYTAFLKLHACHGKTHQAFRNLACRSEGTPTFDA